MIKFRTFHLKGLSFVLYKDIVWIPSMQLGKLLGYKNPTSSCSNLCSLLEEQLEEKHDFIFLPIDTNHEQKLYSFNGAVKIARNEEGKRKVQEFFCSAFDHLRKATTQEYNVYNKADIEQSLTQLENSIQEIYSYLNFLKEDVLKLKQEYI